jgi:hypothetical protein
MFEIPEDPRFRKGCVIGDPILCTAAKAIGQEPHVEFAFVGANVAIVEFDAGDILRYTHNGLIPKSQDDLLMAPPGIYYLIPPCPSKCLGAQRRVGTGKKKNPNAGRRKSFTYTTAGQLRS